MKQQLNIATLRRHLFLLSLLLAAGCAEEDTGIGSASWEAVRFEAVNPGATATPGHARTRTTAAGEEWLPGDKIGIFMLTNGGGLDSPVPGILTVNGLKAENILYTATPVGGDATQATFAPANAGETIYYPQTGENVSIVAYYPHGEIKTTPTTGEVSEDYQYHISVTNQSTEAKQAAIDVLHARKDDVQRGTAAVALDFTHVMSKITLNLKAGDGVDATAVTNLTADDINFTGMPAIATLNLNDLHPTPVAKADFHPLKAETATDTYLSTFTAIIIPNQETGRKVEFTVAGETFIWEISDEQAFVTGEHYVYPVTITKKGVLVGDHQIADWDGKDTPPEAGGIRPAGIYNPEDLVNFMKEWNALKDAADQEAFNKARDEVLSNWTDDGTPTGVIRLQADVNMEGVTGFEPIGGYAYPIDYRFAGKFDGQGHTISGLTINTSDSYVGLFGWIGGGYISHVIMKDCSIETTGDYVGGIVGYNYSGTITACQVIGGTVEGSSYVGGTVGNNSSGTITACQMIGGTMTGSNYVGGIVGQNFDGTITACIAAPTGITASFNKGVVVGFNWDKVATCYWVQGVIGGDPPVGQEWGSVTGGSSFDRNTVAATDNFFTTGNPSPIDQMNTALQTAGSDWRWHPGDASSSHYPIIKKN